MAYSVEDIQLCQIEQRWLTTIYPTLTLNYQCLECSDTVGWVAACKNGVLAFRWWCLTGAFHMLEFWFVTM